MSSFRSCLPREAGRPQPHVYGGTARGRIVSLRTGVLLYRIRWTSTTVHGGDTYVFGVGDLCRHYRLFYVGASHQDNRRLCHVPIHAPFLQAVEQIRVKSNANPSTTAAFASKTKGKRVANIPLNAQELRTNTPAHKSSKIVRLGSYCYYLSWARGCSRLLCDCSVKPYRSPLYFDPRMLFA